VSDRHHAQPSLDAAYARLRRIAQKLMAGERAGHTLSATEVVHEAMAKLLSAGWQPDVNDPEAFVRLVRHAARAMTEVLIDYSRHRNALKRGAGRARVRLDDLDDLEAVIDHPTFDWAALDKALERLQAVDARRHTVVMLRFFGGLDNRQIARQLGVDERTIGRDWAAARLWLKKELEPD